MFVPEVLDLLPDARLRPLADRHHDDHRADPDDDAEHGQQGAHRVLEDALPGDLDEDECAHG